MQQALNIFALKGRLNRGQYFFSVVFLCPLIPLITKALVRTLEPYHVGEAGGANAIIFFAVAVSLWATICLLARRLHDVDMPGETALWLSAIALLLVVYGNNSGDPLYLGAGIAVWVIPTILLYFVAGSKGDNKYGSENKKAFWDLSDVS